MPAMPDHECEDLVGEASKVDGGIDIAEVGGRLECERTSHGGPCDAIAEDQFRISSYLHSVGMRSAPRKLMDKRNR